MLISKLYGLRVSSCLEVVKVLKVVRRREIL